MIGANRLYPTKLLEEESRGSWPPTAESFVILSTRITQHVWSCTRGFILHLLLQARPMKTIRPALQLAYWIKLTAIAKQKLYVKRRMTGGSPRTVWEWNENIFSMHPLHFLILSIISIVVLCYSFVQHSLIQAFVRNFKSIPNA